MVDDTKAPGVSLNSRDEGSKTRVLMWRPYQGVADHGHAEGAIAGALHHRVGPAGQLL